jgi:hypothetical protein
VKLCESKDIGCSLGETQASGENEQLQPFVPDIGKRGDRLPPHYGDLVRRFGSYSGSAIMRCTGKLFDHLENQLYERSFS